MRSAIITLAIFAGYRRDSTDKIDRLNPIVFVRGHVQFSHDVPLRAYLQHFYDRGVEFNRSDECN